MAVDGNARRIAVFGHGFVGEAGVQALCDMGMKPVAIYGHRPDPNDWQSGLAEVAQRLDVPCFVDVDFTDPERVQEFASFNVDLIVSLYYRVLLPSKVLKLARFGGLNLHGSPLPAYRGRAPVNWMVLRGEKVGGATMHVMTRRPDGGPIVAARTFPIASSHTAYDLVLQVRQLVGEILVVHLPSYLDGSVAPVKQGKGTYFGGRRPDDGLIDWTRPAAEVVNLLRAVTRPYPGAFTMIEKRKLFVWWAVPERGLSLPCGQLVQRDGRFFIGTASDALRLVDFTVDRVPVGLAVAELKSLATPG